jgi:hypothetical protein
VPGGAAATPSSVVRFDHEVPDLGGIAGPALEDVAVDHHPGADPGRDGEVDEVLGGVVPGRVFAHQAGDGIVLDVDAWMTNQRDEDVPERDAVDPVEVRRVDDLAGVAVERADGSDADRSERRGGNAGTISGRIEGLSDGFRDR